MTELTQITLAEVNPQMAYEVAAIVYSQSLIVFHHPLINLLDEIW